MAHRKDREKMVLPFTAMPNILVRERLLTTTEKLVLLQIASMGPTGLTISTKAFRQRLIPLGMTGLLRAIKRLVFLGMIKIEKVPRKQGDPAYKKPCHRYFFVKDLLEWRHTIDFRMKLKLEIERMGEKEKINFRTDLFLDEKHLDEAFNKWLTSIKAVGFDKKPEAPAVSPNDESKRWVKKIERLKNGELTFLKVADEAISYASYLESLPENSVICREKVEYMHMIFDLYEDCTEAPRDEQMFEDVDWIEEMKQKGIASEEISRELGREETRRQNNK